MAEDRLLFVGQKVLIDRDGKVLILIDNKNHLDFPGGKIQVTDTHTDKALHREIEEEIKLEIEIGKPFSRMFYTNNYVESRPDDGVYIVVFFARYRAGEVILSDEHRSYEWIDQKSYIKYKDLENSDAFFAVLESYFSHLV